MRRQSYVLVLATVFAVALAMRTIPLYWSPLPSTLDSFAYAGLARDVLASGQYPVSQEIRADFFVLTLLTTVASMFTGKQPVYVIQPVVSIVGTGIVVVGVALTRRLGTDVGLDGRRLKLAALTTGVLLSVEGLFLRRTTVPDPEVLGILLGLLAVITFYRLLFSEDNRWFVPFAVILVTFPLLHIFSTFNAAVAVTAMYALVFIARPTKRTLLLGGTLLGAFWLAFIGYYEFVERYELFRVSYVGRIRSRPGLFIAWLIALTSGAAWYQRIGARLQRAVLLVPLAALFMLVILNIFLPIYPGTVQSPPEVAIMIAFLSVPVGVAGYAAPFLSHRYDYAVPILALLAAPLVVIYFSLTAGLTPDYFATGMRAQTFMHVPVFVLVGLGAVTILHHRSAGSLPWTSLRTVTVAALLVCTLMTVPLAFVTLDTFHYPATTAESEFAATGFTSQNVPGQWTTHHPPDQIAGQYFRGGSSRGPTREWLAGGEPPSCPVLTQDSWTTHGAHFFPSRPLTIDRRAYEEVLGQRNTVYSASGRDPLVLSMPRSGSGDWTCDGTEDPSAGEL